MSDWASDDTLEHRCDDIDTVIQMTAGQPEIPAWHEFIAPLPPAMTLEELRNYVGADNEQQRNDLLRAVAVRLGVDPEDVPPELDRVRVWSMRGPNASTIEAAIYDVQTGRELRVTRADELLESRLSRTDDSALVARAEELRGILQAKGWLVADAPTPGGQV